MPRSCGRAPPHRSRSSRDVADAIRKRDEPALQPRRVWKVMYWGVGLIGVGSVCTYSTHDVRSRQTIRQTSVTTGPCRSRAAVLVPACPRERGSCRSACRRRRAARAAAMHAGGRFKNENHVFVQARTYWNRMWSAEFQKQNAADFQLENFILLLFFCKFYINACVPHACVLVSVLGGIQFLHQLNSCMANTPFY